MKVVTGLFGKMLKFLYLYTGDYGIAIVCLTVIVKLCLIPFQMLQRRNMENPQANPYGCLLLLMQLPIMICLYRSIGIGVTAGTGTRLLPWVESLLVRDRYGILPFLSVLVQLFPQICSYLAFFESLQLPKPAPGMILSSAVMTLILCLPLPSGVGIYYLVSGLFSAVEQTVRNVWQVRQMKNCHQIS